MMQGTTTSIHDIASEIVREVEAKQERDDRISVWVFVWTLFAFKMISGIVIFWAAGWTIDASKVLSVTHWFFLLLPAFVAAGPVIYHTRVRKVRRKRAAMQRAEWMLE